MEMGVFICTCVAPKHSVVLHTMPRTMGRAGKFALVPQHGRRVLGTHLLPSLFPLQVDGELFQLDEIHRLKRSSCTLVYS